MSNALARFFRPTARGATDLGLLTLRIWVGFTLAFEHGLSKVLSLGKFIGTVEKHGFPLPHVLGPAAALSEFLGGILLAIGLFTRPAATFVLATMLGAALKVHAGDPFSKKELAFAYGLVALAVLLAGPGRYSLDARLEKRR